MCKCNELAEWLKEEISSLEEMKNSVSEDSRLYHVLCGKIDALLVVRAGLDF